LPGWANTLRHADHTENHHGSCFRRRQQAPRLFSSNAERTVNTAARQQVPVESAHSRCTSFPTMTATSVRTHHYTLTRLSLASQDGYSPAQFPSNQGHQPTANGCDHFNTDNIQMCNLSVGRNDHVLYRTGISIDACAFSSPIT